jgi:hypothetical protein
LTKKKHFVLKDAVANADELYETTKNPTTSYVDEDGNRIRGGGWSESGLLFALDIYSATGRPMPEIREGDPHLANLIEMYVRGAKPRAAITQGDREKIDAIVDGMEKDVLDLHLPGFFDWLHR